MNNGWDEFSMPKEVGRQLIAMHIKRGDSIYFVTGRSQTKTETVSKTLQDDFLIPGANMNPVILPAISPARTRKLSGYARRISKSSTATLTTISRRPAMPMREEFACCVRQTPPINLCRWRGRRGKR